MSQKQPQNRSLSALRLIAALLLIIAILIGVQIFLAIGAQRINPQQGGQWEYSAWIFHDTEKRILTEDSFAAMSDPLYQSFKAIEDSQSDTERSLADYLNAASEQGWELVETRDYSRQFDWFWLIFRRSRSWSLS